MNLSEAVRAVHKAADDCIALSSDRQWVRMEVNWTDTIQPKICIHYGAIHSNGMREIAIGTRHYYIDEKGEPTFYIQGHP
jgi:hypothetical protein